MMKRKSESDNGFAEWGGYMGAKMSKLEDQFREASERNVMKKNIFNGVSIFVNGYTVPSADELKLLMLDYGGVYHYYHTNNTTYMVASNLPAAKMKQLKTVKVIRPEWVVDCVSEGRLLDHKPYLLYSDIEIHQRRLNFIEKSNVNTAIIDVGNESAHVQDEMAARRFKPTKTASDDNFISEFYNNSRLHHISTMGATFKEYVTNLRNRKPIVFCGREELKQWRLQHEMLPDGEEIDFDTERTIMHIDMDCFFVSVGIRNKPELRGKPVVVTHAKGNKVNKREGMDRQLEFNLYSENCKEKLKYRSHEAVINHQGTERSWFQGIGETDSMAEIACCSYEARKCGLKNGMLLGRAMQLCPSLVTIPYDFEGYKEVSYALYDYVARFTLDIEAVSCDEMYVDCTEVLTYANASPLQFAAFLRTNIKKITGCPCSTGFGPNILIARLATKKAKPDGQYYVKREDAKTFLQQFSVSDLPGVGHSISSKLLIMGINTCKELQTASLSSLQLEFGSKTGLTLHKHAHGKDDRQLSYEHQRKSVSADVNYGIRFENQLEAEKFLKSLSEEVESRLNKIKMEGKCITLKLMTKAKGAPAESAKFLGHGVCNYITKSASLSVPTSSSIIIFREVMKIVRNLSVDAKNMRGIGIQVSKLEKKKCCNLTISKFLKSETSVVKNDISGKCYPINPGTSNKPSKENEKKNLDFYFSRVTDVSPKKSADDVLPNMEDEMLNSDSNSSDSIRVMISKKSPQKGVLLRSEQQQNFGVNSKARSRTLKAKGQKKIKKGPICGSKNATGKVQRSLNDVPYFRSNSLPLYKDLSMSQVDPEFLEALPEDIRAELKAEIQRHSKFKLHAKNPENSSSIEQKNVEEVEIREEVSDAGRISEIFNDPEEMKSLIKQWTSKTSDPDVSEIDRLKSYLQQKILERHLERVETMLRYFNRMVKKYSTCESLYEGVVDSVQETMKSVYGSMLLVDS